MYSIAEFVGILKADTKVASDTTTVIWPRGIQTGDIILIDPSSWLKLMKQRSMIVTLTVGFDNVKAGANFS